MTFGLRLEDGSALGADKKTSHGMLDRFVDAGGNFIDTANVYSRGLSEEIIGEWLKSKNRGQLVLATKVRFAMGEGPNDVGVSRKNILRSVEESLRRLATDHIDLYQVHCWDEGTPLEETLSTLEDLVRSGKVRYIGASNFAGWQLQKALDISRASGFEAFCCLQPLYNLLDRYTEWDLLPVCRREGLGIIPWSPLRGGWLTGKYRRGMSGPPASTRVDAAEKHGWGEAWSRYNVERTWNVLDELFLVSEEMEKEPSQVALNWLIHRPGVTAAILGARTEEQLETNLGSLGWSLTEEHTERLDRVSAQPPPYPHDFIAQAQKGREK
jgi:aryl-alcohol dehydrogenase-like predicted oxidoreductase